MSEKEEVRRRDDWEERMAEEVKKALLEKGESEEDAEDAARKWKESRRQMAGKWEEARKRMRKEWKRKQIVMRLKNDENNVKS
jgi:predicted nucleotide-binding protein (sugar kinase/HSP70/actin superfamily)